MPTKLNDNLVKTARKCAREIIQKPDRTYWVVSPQYPTNEPDAHMYAEREMGAVIQRTMENETFAIRATLEAYRDTENKRMAKVTAISAELTAARRSRLADATYNEVKRLRGLELWEEANTIAGMVGDVLVRYGADRSEINKYFRACRMDARGEMLEAVRIEKHELALTIEDYEEELDAAKECLEKALPYVQIPADNIGPGHWVDTAQRIVKDAN